MRTRTRHITFTILALLAVSCGLSDDYRIIDSDSRGDWKQGGRLAEEESRRVTLLYSLGVNNLRPSLDEDINDISGSWIPQEGRKGNVLLVFSHSGQADNYYAANRPVLFRIFRDHGGNVVRDTVKVWGGDDCGTSPEMVTEVFNFVRANYGARSYGAVFTSHGSGWLPANYYTNSSEFDRAYSSTEENTPTATVRKNSFGAHYIKGGKAKEIEIQDLAEALPYKLDYIVFDACLMGGVEVAYELKDKCRLLAASPTEILSDGFDYVNLEQRLIGSDDADVVGVCEDYYKHYLAKTGSWQSATISCIDCGRLEPLAKVCAEIFSEQRDRLRTLSESGIQRYYRGSYHWFYDLRSILRQLPLKEGQLERVDAALGEAVLYNEATDKFLEITISEHCGLSSYLPSRGSAYLDNYYKKLKWNEATRLIE